MITVSGVLPINVIQVAETTPVLQVLVVRVPEQRIAHIGTTCWAGWLIGAWTRDRRLLSRLTECACLNLEGLLLCFTVE